GAAAKEIWLHCYHNKWGAIVARGGGKFVVQKYGDPKKAVQAKESGNQFDPYKSPPGKFQFEGKGFGEWNSLTLTSKNGTLEIVVNGKHSITVGDCEPSEGFLGLQVDGRETHLRNVQIQELPSPEPACQPLFNGKDLTGFIVLPDQPNNWKVTPDGHLTCSGAASHLFTGRGDYENFHVRLEAKINDKGNSGLFFRSRFQQDKQTGFPPGYEAQINSTHPDLQKTGSLYGLAGYHKMLVKPDEWFVLDVVCVGNRITVKVNGDATADFVDDKKRFVRGHFALQHHDPGTAVHFRKIEIQELPASKD